MEPATLALTDVVAGYGFGDVLRGVTLDVPPGKVTCIIGPNGAGKSTLVKAVSGLVKVADGEIRFGDRSLVRKKPREILLLGIAHVAQERSLFPQMSVWENLMMGGYLLADRSVRRDRASEVAERFPFLQERRHAQAGTLSGGQQRVLEIARALMLKPTLLIMDEVSMGLDLKSRSFVFDTIAALPEQGSTVLMVEQNARSGLAVCDHGVVMEAGVVRLRDHGSALLANPEVERLFLGRRSRFQPPVGAAARSISTKAKVT